MERNLALRVLHYVEHEREEIVRRTKSTSSRIFLSDRSGNPLTDGAVPGIFNKARRTLEWPTGAGLHSWRRGFANAYIEREIDARIELGLDTGGEAIAMSLATALGHEVSRVKPPTCATPNAAFEALQPFATSSTTSVSQTKTLRSEPRSPICVSVPNSHPHLALRFFLFPPIM
jgi:hypothetical protein